VVLADQPEILRLDCFATRFQRLEHMLYLSALGLSAGAKEGGK
jgi:hypothetical protein